MSWDLAWHRYSTCKSATCCSWRTSRQPWGSWWCQTSMTSCCSLVGTLPKSMQTSTHRWKMGHPTGWTTNWLWPCSAIRPSEQVPLSDEHWRWCSPSHWSSLMEWAQGTGFSRPEWRAPCQFRGWFCKPIVLDSLSTSFKWSFLRCPGNFHNVHHEHGRQVLLWPNLPEEHLACEGLAEKGVFLFWQTWKPIWKAKASYPGPVCVLFKMWMEELHKKLYDVATERIWDMNSRSGVFSDFPSCWNLWKVYAIFQYTCCSPLML